MGARPQFIKCAPVSRELRREHTEILVHTGQHYDPEMSDIFFEELQIPKPDYHLGAGSGSHGKQTGEILAKTEDVLAAETPDLVLVYGDTNSTLAGALAAVKLQIPVAHVEAGLRSFDRAMPEEINRIVADHVSDLLFCPTQTAVDNLRAEGITRGVHLVGDVMADALAFNRQIAEERSPILERLGVSPQHYLVLTIHRPSNADNRGHMETIFAALAEPGIPVVFPVHPRTRKYLEEYGMWDRLPAPVPGNGTAGIARHDPADGICADDPHRLRRHAEGSVHAGRSLYHAPGEYRVGGDAGGRLECAGRGGGREDPRCAPGTARTSVPERFVSAGCKQENPGDPGFLPPQRAVIEPVPKVGWFSIQ